MIANDNKQCALGKCDHAIPKNVIIWQFNPRFHFIQSTLPHWITIRIATVFALLFKNAGAMNNLETLHNNAGNAQGSSDHTI